MSYFNILLLNMQYIPLKNSFLLLSYFSFIPVKNILSHLRIHKNKLSLLFIGVKLAVPVSEANPYTSEI